MRKSAVITKTTPQTGQFCGAKQTRSGASGHLHLKAIGAEVCRAYRFGYYHCDELVSELVAVRKIEFKQYQKKVKTIINLDLVYTCFYLSKWY